jgi:hypothetical protein
MRTAALVVLLASCTLPALGDQKRMRRVLYNIDGDSCMSTKAGTKGWTEVGADDLKQAIREVTFEGSQVDTVLVCIIAQVMYYPTKVGTLRGTLSTADEKAKWPASEKMRWKNAQALFDAKTDPYALMLAEIRKRGREALLSFRMNDDHGNDFLRTKFWADHPDMRLSRGALDFGHEKVRDYVARLIEEAVKRYDSDGIDLDFNRFPAFFKGDKTDERVAKMNGLVERVRRTLDEVGKERGRQLVLAVRVPSNFGRTPPTPETVRALGCDPQMWAKRGWVDFVTVSEFLFERYNLPLKTWKEAIRDVPVYGGIECTESGNRKGYLTAEKYRRASQRLRKEGADGVYLFNFFTTREYEGESWEPPFEVLGKLWGE